MNRKAPTQKYQKYLITASLPAALSVFGLFLVYSVVYEENILRFQVQLFAVLAGMTGMVLLSALDFRRFRRSLSLLLYGISVSLLVLTLLIGDGPGNKSWISIPGLILEFQPSELVKVLFIFTFSQHIARLEEEKRLGTLRGIAALFFHFASLTALVLAQRDVGNALIYCFICAVMLIAARLRMRYYIGSIAGLAASAPLLWHFMGEHRRQRVLAGFHPAADPDGYGYQALKSMAAIAAGGITGNGWLALTAAREVPALHTDMILAALAEQFGILGVLFLILLETALILRIIVIAARTDMASSLLCIGVSALIFGQFIISVGMCLGQLPVIGVTLPFISYGGSSVFSLFCACGLVLAADKLPVNDAIK